MLLKKSLLAVSFFGVCFATSNSDLSLLSMENGLENTCVQAPTIRQNNPYNVQFISNIRQNNPYNAQVLSNIRQNNPYNAQILIEGYSEDIDQEFYDERSPSASSQDQGSPSVSSREGTSPIDSKPGDNENLGLPTYHATMGLPTYHQTISLQ